MENRVLLVEDEAPFKRSLEKFLLQAGYTFDSCSTAHAALALVERSAYNVVIVEYHLPDANGARLLEKLMHMLPNAAAIIVSEYDFQVVAADLVRVDIHSFMKKPFDLVELEVALSSACSKARILMRELKRKAEACFKVYLPPSPNRELLDVRNCGRMLGED